MAAKFEIRSPQAGQYVWVLTSQGRTLATSATYSRRAAAEDAVVSFRMVAVNAPVLDTTVPAAETAGKAARTTGRVVAKAVVRGGRAVEKVEQTAAKVTKRATGVARRVAEATKDERGGTATRPGKRQGRPA